MRQNNNRFEKYDSEKHLKDIDVNYHNNSVIKMNDGSGKENTVNASNHLLNLLLNFWSGDHIIFWGI